MCESERDRPALAENEIRALLLWEGSAQVRVDPEILALAQEIAGGSDVPGLEQWRLEWLVRAALSADRRIRP